MVYLLAIEICELRAAETAEESEGAPRERARAAVESASIASWVWLREGLRDTKVGGWSKVGRRGVNRRGYQPRRERAEEGVLEGGGARGRGGRRDSRSREIQRALL